MKFFLLTLHLLILLGSFGEAQTRFCSEALFINKPALEKDWMNAALLQYTKQNFPEVFKKWAQALPEFIETSEVLNLLNIQLHPRRSALSELDAKKLSAINLLVRNNYVFLSSNAEASGVAAGIYPFSDMPLVTQFHIEKVNFSEQLFEALAQLSYIYQKGHWVIQRHPIHFY